VKSWAWLTLIFCSSIDAAVINYATHATAWHADRTQEHDYLAAHLPLALSIDSDARHISSIGFSLPQSAASAHTDDSITVQWRYWEDLRGWGAANVPSAVLDGSDGRRYELRILELFVYDSSEADNPAELFDQGSVYFAFTLTSSDQSVSLYYRVNDDYDWSRVSIDDDPAPVPEPSTLALFGLGLAAFAWKRRKS